MQFFTVEKLSKHRETTPEGYLLCTEVPIARTGVQIYGPGETPITPGPDGYVKVTREAKEVFRADTIKSFNGKSLADDHPENDIVPATWKELTIGVVFNVRRGSGVQDDLLLADILITDPEGIRLVLEEGKEELSCGYDADYEEDAPGEGRQVNIIGNHVALVWQGRCGSRCSIQDSAGGSMKKVVIDKFSEFRDKLVKAHRTGDCKAVEKVLDEAAEHEETVSSKDHEGSAHIHLHNAGGHDSGLEERLATLEAGHAVHDKRIRDCEGRLGMVRDGETEEEKKEREKAEKETADRAKDAADKAKDESEKQEREKEEKETQDEYEEEAPEGTGDKARKANDSAYFEESFQATVSNAEILSPGIAIPTYDKAAAPKKTFDAICGLRREAILKANETEEGKVIIATLRGGKPLTKDSLDKMKCGQVRTLFNGAVLAAKTTRSSMPGMLAMPTSDVIAPGGIGMTGIKQPPALTGVNKLNEEFWAKQK